MCQVHDVMICFIDISQALSFSNLEELHFLGVVTLWNARRWIMYISTEELDSKAYPTQYCISALFDSMLSNVHA